MITLYGIKSCGSVKKALAFFKEKGIEVRFVDFKSTPVGCEKIDEWLRLSNLETLLNTKGTTYKTLNLKAQNLNDAQKRDYLCSHNLLIKRPVIEVGQRLIVGFDPNIYEGIVS
ncbi:MAG: arsenate reductase family protein [Campylobacterales bacterium]|nr:arsenate reductase family protein [Campylobacterales bacterium]